MSVVIVAVLSAALVGTDFAQRELIEQQQASMEAFGFDATPEMEEQFAQQLAIAPYMTLGSTLVGIPIVCLILAGVLYGVGSGFLGAQATFRQMLAVVSHAGVIFALQQLFVVPLNYARESIQPPTTLAAFTPMLDDETFVYPSAERGRPLLPVVADGTVHRSGRAVAARDPTDRHHAHRRVCRYRGRFRDGAHGVRFLMPRNLLIGGAIALTASALVAVNLLFTPLRRAGGGGRGDRPGGPSRPSCRPPGPFSRSSRWT